MGRVNRTIPITIHVPETAFYRLAKYLTRGGRRIPDVLLDIALVTARKADEGSTDPVVYRHAAGWPDKVIARDLGVTNTHVQNVRRTYGLPANSWHEWVKSGREG